jgi:type I restriction-modification system DNA methylase subunit
MLAKIATAGQNGLFRTPRHIIATMVELVQPKPDDVICDPACGTCGSLVVSGEYLRRQTLTRDYGVGRIQQYPLTASRTAVRRRNRFVLHRPRRQNGQALSFVYCEDEPW